MFLSSVLAQHVPKGDFDSWEERLIYEEPEWWRTGNFEAMMKNIQTAFRSSDAYRGTYCLSLESASIEAIILLDCQRILLN